ncbi:hypothetical protein Hanom_Chr00s197588g01837111 [Helianthus anomalus]
MQNTDASLKTNEYLHGPHISGIVSRNFFLDGIKINSLRKFIEYIISVLVARLLDYLVVLVSTFNYLAYHDAMLMSYLVMSCGKRIIFFFSNFWLLTIFYLMKYCGYNVSF